MNTRDLDGVMELGYIIPDEFDVGDDSFSRYLRQERFQATLIR
jgi:hypothetical protein